MRCWARLSRSVCRDLLAADGLGPSTGALSSQMGYLRHMPQYLSMITRQATVTGGEQCDTTTESVARSVPLLLGLRRAA